MKRMKQIFILFAALLAASCSTDDGLLPGTDNGELQEFTFAVGIDRTMTGDIDPQMSPLSRAVSDTEDEKPIRCFMQVLDKATEAPAAECRYVQRGTSTAEGSYTFRVTLAEGKQYIYLFWADNNTGETVTDLTNVTYTPGDIAFAAKTEGVPENVKTITLTHVVTKVTLKTTSNIPANTKVSVTLSNTYTHYNVSGGTTGITQAYPYEHTATNLITGTTDGTPVFSFYALVANGEQQVTINNGILTKQLSAPLVPNRHVILKGSAGIDGLEIDDNGTWIVSTATALRAWGEAARENLSLNCTLAADIALTGTDNWTPVGSNESVMYTGTFNGAGHTISGLDIEENASDVVVNGGLIGALGKGGIVKNLTVTNANIKETNSHPIGSAYVGGIVGQCMGGTISGCGFSGSVVAEGQIPKDIYVGGIVGYMNYSVGSPTITGCWSVIESISEAGCKGAIAGGAVNANVNSCYYDYDGNGLGYTLGTTDNTQKVDGAEVTWTIASEEMNKVLTGYKWVVTGNTDVPLKLEQN